MNKIKRSYISMDQVVVTSYSLLTLCENNLKPIVRLKPC